MTMAASGTPAPALVFAYKTLFDDTTWRSSLPLTTAVHLLDPARDGLAQIVDILANYRDLAAIHLLTHGAAGQLNLGTVTLTTATLAAYRDQLVQIGAALVPDGDVLLYSCNVATGETGAEFVAALAAATGADVAASIDATGAAARGGDWELEAQVGNVTAAPLQLTEFDTLLAAPVFLPAAAGTTITDFGQFYSSSHDVLVLADGKILVTGRAHNPSEDFGLVRYNADGSLDTTFGAADASGGHTGRVMTDFGDVDTAYSLTLQSDGSDVKILVAGKSGDTNVALARYSADGVLDTSFGSGGKVTVSLGDVPSQVDQTVLVDADGILVAGKSGLARYTSAGVLDTAFDTDGKITTVFSGGSDEITSIAFDVGVNAGKILVAGTMFPGLVTGYDIGLARYNADGSLDDTFGTDGLVETDNFDFLGNRASDHGNALAVQSDGKILVAGSYQILGITNFFLARYDTNGSLDTTFDTDGKVFSSAGSKIQSLLIDSDGKILVAGLGTGGGVLVRYNADGSLDTTFDTDGILSGQLGLGYDEDYSVALTADGKILLAGKTRDDTDGEFALARYTSTGALDTTFSPAPTFTENGGEVVIDDALRVYDAELADAGAYTGASLTIARTDGANAVDTFSFATAGASFISSGGNLQSGGQPFATFTNSDGTLTVNFSGTATTPTQALVNDVLQHIAYQNSSDTPPASVELTWTFNDGTTNVTTTTTVNITAVADTPVINSNGGGATAAINAAENQTTVTTVIATDADGTTPTYSISGGADQTKFTIDTNTGALTFNSAPDFESPTDSDSNNAYLVTVTATDGVLSDTQDLTVTVTNIADAPPVINSNGSGATAAINAAENQTTVTTITATDADGTTPTYSISGGADAAKFSINATSGALTFNSAPDFENPTDSDTNNAYLVTVTATDGMLTDTQDLTISVTDVSDTYIPPPYVPPPNQPPTILAVPSIAQPVLLGIPSDLIDVQVADTDGDFFTLSLTPSNGTLGNLIDAQPATSNLELIGNAATLNAALAHATFTATARGAASITFAVTDIAGATSVATYPLIATGNRAPMLTGAAPILLPNGQEDTPYTVQATTLLTGWSDADGDVLQVVNLSSNQGAVTGNSLYTLTPTLNYAGIVTFNYGISDGIDTTITTGHFTMTAVNDSPNFAGNRAPVMTGNRVPIFTGYAGTRLAKSSTDWLEDTSYTINASELLAGWLDPDGDVLKVANLSAHVGDLKDNGNGTYTLTPPANYFGTVVLSYQISDGFSSAPATRYLAVSPVNDAPTLSMFADAVATGIEDRVITITLANLRNQGDEDDVDDNVSAFMVKEVNNGTLKIGISSASARAWAAGSNDVVDATHRAYWTPATKESGLLDAFTVVAKDTHGAKSDTPCQVQVQVTPINHLPQGTDVTLTTDEDVSLQLSAADFGFNDIDEDDILNEVQITALETAGALQYDGVEVELGQIISKADIDAGKLVFIPEQDANGDNYATLAFKVNDGKAWSSANNTLTINVTVVNDVPITTNKNPTATDAVLTAEAKTPLIFTADQFGFSDEDADDVLVNIQITTLSSAGDLQYNGAAVELDQIISKADIDAGKLVFTATTALKTTIGFKVSDGKAWSTAPNALNIDVTAALNTAPTITGIPAEPQKVTASKPTDLADVTVADDDRDSLTVTLTPSNGKMGGLTDADTKIAGIQLIGTAADINDALIAATFTAIKDGTASIGFSVTDSKETTTATYELIVDSSPTPPTTNHAPTIKGIPTAPQTVTVSEAADLADVTVADDDRDSLTVTLTPLNGKIGGLSDADTKTAGIQLKGTAEVINAALKNATFTTAATTVDANIKFSVTDSKETTTATYELIVDSSPTPPTTNHAPTIKGIPTAPQTVTVSEAADLADVTVADVDSDSLTVTLTPSNGTIDGLSDADTKTAGIQLKGTAEVINAALKNATFTTAATTVDANIKFSVTDSKETTTATYELIVDSSPTPPTTNHAPTIKGIPTAPQTVTVSEAADLADVTVADIDSDLLTVTLTPSNGTIDGLTDADTKIAGIQLIGTAADINDALKDATFTATKDGKASIGFSVTDSEETATATYNLNALKTIENRAPTIKGIPTAPQTVTVSEAADLADVTVADIDSDSLTVTLTPSNGKMGGLTDADTKIAGIQLIGTAADINDALKDATFTAGKSGKASIGFSVTDSEETTTATYNLTTSKPIENRAPTIKGIPTAPQTVTVLKPADLADVTVADIDSDSLTVTLTPSNGKISGLTDADTKIAGIQLIGTAADINDALKAATFTATKDGKASIGFSVTDSKETTTATYELIVDSSPTPPTTNRAPTIKGIPTAPQTVTVSEAADLADVTVADVDSDSLTVTLTPSNGTIDGLTDADTKIAGIQLIGTAADINDALKDATFTAGKSGKASIGFSVTDSEETATATYNLTASKPIENRAPTIKGIPTAPQKVTASKPTDLADVTVADADGDSLTVTLTPSNGSIGGLEDADSAIAGIQLIGTAADINDALIAATFTAAKSGDAAIEFSVKDAEQTTTATYALIANSAPTISGIPTTAQAVTVSKAADLADVTVYDADGDSLTITIDAANGRIGGLTDADTSYSSPGIQLNGTALEINTALENATFTATKGGAASVQFVVKDTDGANDIDVYKLTANTTPTISGIPTTAQLVAVSKVVDLADVTVTDADDDLLTVTVASKNGSVGGLADADVKKTGIQLKGTAEFINAALKDATFTPTNSGIVSIDFTVEDAATSPVSASYKLTAVMAMPNRAPTISGIPTAPQTVTILKPADLADVVIADVDSDSLTVTLTPTNGSIGGLTDADTKIAGIQLIGTAADINDALIAATFTAAKSGDAAIEFSVKDAEQTTTETYNLNAIPNRSPTISGIPTTAQFVTVSKVVDLADVTVTDADDDLLTVTVASKNGSVGGLADADVKKTGIQLKGTAEFINADLKDATFTPTNSGIVSIDFTVEDAATSPVSASYKLMALTTNNTPTISGIPTAPQAVTVSKVADLADITVADADGDSLTVTLTPSNGSIGGLEDADSAIAGIQLKGTVDTINAALEDATFTAAGLGNASIRFLIDDSEDATTAVYNLTASAAVNHAPTISGIPSTAQTITIDTKADLAGVTVADADGDSLTVTLTPTNGSIGGLTDADTKTKGIQLIGTAADINDALKAATFTAATIGKASIGFSVTDSKETKTATYELAVAAASVAIPSTLSDSEIVTTDGSSYKINLDGDKLNNLLSLSASKSLETRTPKTDTFNISTVIADLAALVFGATGLTATELTTGTTTNGSDFVSMQLTDDLAITFIIFPDNKVAFDYTLSNLFLSDIIDLTFLSENLFEGVGFSKLEFVLTPVALVDSVNLDADKELELKIDANPGVTLLGELDLEHSKNKAFHFISEFFGINLLSVSLNLNPLPLPNSPVVILKGSVLTDIPLIDFSKIGYLKIDFTERTLNLSIASDGTPTISVLSVIRLEGYDPTQSKDITGTDEPTLYFTTELALDTTAASLSVNLDTVKELNAVKDWKSPFGFANATISKLGFQVGATYLPPFLDNFGFIVDMEWGSIDINLGVSYDMTDPEKMAFSLTFLNEVNIAELIAQIGLLSVGINPATLALSALVASAEDLFQYIPLTIVSVDSKEDADSKIDPLVYFVPFPTSIGTQTLKQGFGINGQVSIAGKTGSLSLNADSSFSKLSGELTLPSLKLGDWLEISGINDENGDGKPDLISKFAISQGEQYMSGSGKFVLFGENLVSANYSISPTAIHISKTELPISGLATIKIDYLDADLQSMSARGKADILLFGLDTLKIMGTEFVFTPGYIKFHGSFGFAELFEIVGDFELDLAAKSLKAEGTINIGTMPFSNTSITINETDGFIATSETKLSLGALGTWSVTITTKFDLDDILPSVFVAVDLDKLGHVDFFIDPNLISDLATLIEQKCLTGIGELPSWLQGPAKAGLAVLKAIFDSAEAMTTAIADFFHGIERKTGNAYDNWLQGGDAKDIIYGNEGNDTLRGGDDKDTLDGGGGNDLIYGDDNTDELNGGNGNDTIYGGTKEDKIYGGLDNDLIYGEHYLDSIYGGLGNDTIYGGDHADLIKGDGGDDHLYDGFADKPDTYNDTLYGGAGDDHYHYLSAGDQIIEEKGEGTDTVYSSVSYTLASNFENLVLTGNAWVIGIGNELNNVLTGNGAESLLIGKTGNDTYYLGVGSKEDTLDELANEGIDTVCSDITYVLLPNFENLTLTGKAAIDGTGNSLNNILTGNSGKNELTGLAGNDTYYVSLGDTVKELANEGIDTVYSDITHTLSANVENLTLTGKGDINGTGNGSNNILTGNSGANTLIGLAGNDVYYVQNTTDKVTEAVNSGIDTVYSSVDFTLSSNVENLTLIGEDDPATEVIEGNINGTGNDLNNTLTGNKGKNTLTGLAGDDVYYVDVKDTVIEGKDAGTDAIFYNGSDEFTLPNNVENLTLTGAGSRDNPIFVYGTKLDNILSSSTFSWLSGGAGDDTYYVISDIVMVFEHDRNTGLDTGGIDTVYSSSDHTLNNNIENLTLAGTANINGTGNAWNNILVGNSGKNTLTGMAGDDTYYVQNTDDTVSEKDGAGKDPGGNDTVYSSVTFTLGTNSNIEHLTLTGSDKINGEGNSLNNVIIGNSGTNTLTGYEGDDTYYVQNADDTVIEQYKKSGKDTGGNDTVYSTVTFTLGNNIEQLILTSTTAIDGTGNSLSNTLTGNTANNVLDGKGGVDTLIGGEGDDTYYVDSDKDTVTEKANEGTDTVNSSITYILGTTIENLMLTGVTAINGTGNALNNVLTGNDNVNTLIGLAGNDLLIGGKGNDTLDSGTGDDTLIGGSGKDSLTGGAGQDVFQFAGKDTAIITDFSITDDKIVLERDAFTSLSRIGALDATAFCINTTGKADDADDRIVYNSDDGKLYYDADGSGTGTAQQFALIQTTGVVLTAAHFDVV